MSVPIYIFSVIIIFGTVLLIFAMKYLSSARQAQAKIATDDAYRKLAETAVATQATNADSLAAIQGQLAEIKGRLAAVEKVLKEV